MTKKAKSEPMKAVHGMMEGFQQSGAIDKQSMREFDDACLTSTPSDEKSWIIASDVNRRDGIGVELWLKSDLVLEIFRDDSKRTREVTLYRKDVPLELIEEAIARFKSEIPWDFLD